MFEIDLLKGKGRPYKPSPKRIILAGALLAIPVITVMAYAVGLQCKRVELASLQKETAGNESQLAAYADDIRFLTDLRGQIDTIAVSVAEVGQALRFRQTVSDMLVATAQELPASIVLREMDFIRSSQRERKTDDKGNVQFETKINRGVHLTLCGNEDPHTDAAVQEYIGRLKAAPAMACRLNDIRTASRQQQTVDGRSTILYKLELTFKEQR